MSENVFYPNFRKPVEPGGGGPYGPDMEGRLAKLEADMGDVKGAVHRVEALLTKIDDRLRRVELEASEIKGRVSQLPSTIQLMGFALAIFAAAGILRYFVR